MLFDQDIAYADKTLVSENTGVCVGARGKCLGSTLLFKATVSPGVSLPHNS